jgi:hypothetical protein
MKIKAFSFNMFNFFPVFGCTYVDSKYSVSPSSAANKSTFGRFRPIFATFGKIGAWIYDNFLTNRPDRQ